MNNLQLNNTNMNNLNSAQSDTLADIQNLQTIESEIQNNLETRLAQGDLTTDEANTMTDQINSIATMRMNLYNSLGSYNEFYKTNLQFANNTLYQQTQILNILESKLNDNRKKILALAENKNNNVRLAEINTYYGEKYKAQTKFMKIIIVLILPVLITAILVKKDIIPYIVFKVVSVIVGIITFFFLTYQLYFFSSRNNMQYKETNYTFNNTIDTSGNNTNDKDPWFVDFTCTGSNCCSTGMTFDKKLNQCVEVESFENLSPANTPSLSSNPNALPVAVHEKMNKENNHISSESLNYKNYKDTTNKQPNESMNWDNILASFNKLISSTKPDYTMGMDSISGYSK